MGTVFTVLAVIAFAAAVLGLFAPRLALAWLPFIQHTPLKAVSLYLFLALFLMLAGQNAATNEEEELAAQAEEGLSGSNATNATAGAVVESNATKSIRGNETGQAGQLAQPEENATLPAVELDKNATQPAVQPDKNATRPAAQLDKNATQPVAPQNAVKEKSTMDEAQEAVSRAANATVEFGRDAANKIGETGNKLYEGAKDIGKELLE